MYRREEVDVVATGKVGRAILDRSTGCRDSSALPADSEVFDNADLDSIVYR
jgi:hypothetical protein